MEVIADDTEIKKDIKLYDFYLNNREDIAPSASSVYLVMLSCTRQKGGDGAHEVLYPLTA